MTDTADFDLGDFADEQTAGDAGMDSAAADAAAVPPDLTEIFLKAQIAAMEPRPTLREMIDTVLIVRYETEDVQSRLLHVGATREPTVQYMRRAAILNAASNFLSMIDANQEAVRAVLKKRPKP